MRRLSLGGRGHAPKSNLTRACEASQKGSLAPLEEVTMAVLSATLLRWLYLLFLTIREARLGALPFIACQEEGVGYQ